LEYAWLCLQFIEVMRESSQTQLNQNRWYILKLEQKTTCFGQEWPSSGLLWNT
jgi:hypothetical protein